MVRVLAHQLKSQVSKDTADGYRLVTTLLDARRDPARHLAAIYHERWEVESVFAEIKTHQRGARVVLSRKTPMVSVSRSGRICWSSMPCANSY
ncbi:transposase [Streptomyces sp. HUAS TT20]|uniref:transposase n=1 Tax=Streptomyces sp. HUAS TT20 TaxID=3447509 RepID=UPI0021DAD397|nr:transposase [Streptomyces sp. HUAS 15-9]UXY32332.1 transposase [Streptomyces sp. HUAS 15-9]